jgi:glycyl-tRNA synthetase beta chain
LKVVSNCLERTMADLLLEVGLEEIPARMIAAAEAELARRVHSLLLRERLAEPGPENASAQGLNVTSYSTPRRLAVFVQGVLLEQPGLEEQFTGPSWKVAFSGGAPTAAAQAFAKKAGVGLSSLEKITTPKGEYAAARVHRPGQRAAEVLTAHLAKEIASLSWPKTMVWRPGKPERFVRPLRWLLCLLDESVLPIEFAGVRATNFSYGHRILHGEAPVAVARPADYPAALRAAFVMVEVETRRRHIRKSMDAAARTIPGARWREDEALLEQTVQLTEWPTAIRGDFDPEYLELPEEVLVTVMRGHQKYFAVEDSQTALAPHFLAVLNTEADREGLAIIRHGNARVLRARFNDARFFWNADQRVPLVERVELLRAVTFQKNLGSYFAKTETNLRAATALAVALAAARVSLDPEALAQAVRLAKTDLTTGLVQEFTELQGVIGGLYARAQGLGEVVAQAVATQYIPASIDDRIPSTVEGQVLGLADRLMTIAEMFAIGLEPSGSKDPFALRRAANGVIKILAESGLPLTLAAIEQIAVESSARARSVEENSQRNGDSLAAFLRERLDFYLREARGFPYDVVNAVLAAGLTTVPDAVARAQALTDVRGSEDLLAISAAFKRIKNILRQAREEENRENQIPDGQIPDAHGESPSDSVSREGLIELAERRLYAEAGELAPQVEALRSQQDYPHALERIAALRPAIDAFFDTVMVMAPEAHLRKNRLSLIASVLGNFSRIADFSEIVN